MNKTLLLKREDKLKSFSHLRLKQFKEVHNYDLNVLINTVDNYCQIFNPEGLRKEMKVSLRKAMMVVFQSRLIKEQRVEGRLFYGYQSILNGAKSEFVFGNRNLKKFPTLDYILPADPNKFFEEHPQRLSYFKTVVLQILINNAWMLLNDEGSKVFDKFLDTFYDL